MADSSPSLQTNAPGFIGEITSTHDTSLAASQKEASARLASEFFQGSGSGLTHLESKPSTPEGTGLSRAVNVLAGGLTDGVIDSAKNSLNLKTVETVAESVGIGYGLGALSKAGSIGQGLALAGGLAMTGAWAYSELKAGRPQATINAVEDAYSSSANLAQDRQSVAANGGAMAFEMGLATLSGGLGMAAGMRVKPNWHVDAIGKAQSMYGSAADFLARDGRLNGAHILGQGDVGMAFAGKDGKAGASDLISSAKDIISGKSKSSGSLADIQETFARSQAQKNDAHLLDFRAQLVDLEGQHAVIRGEEGTLGTRLTKAVKEKADLESFDGLEHAVRVKQQGFADAQEAGRKISDQQKVVDRLFTEKQAAFQKQVPKPGEPVDQTLREDFQQRQETYLSEKAKLDGLKADGSPEAVQRQRQGLEEARAALTRAQQEQPAKLAEAQRNIDSINEQLASLRERRAALEAQIEPLVKSYATRLDALVRDPSQLVQAQFEPPQPVAAKAATARAEVAAPTTASDTASSAAQAAEAISREAQPTSRIAEEVPKDVIARTLEERPLTGPANLDPVITRPIAMPDTLTNVGDTAAAPALSSKPAAAIEATEATAKTAETPARAEDPGVERLSPAARQSREAALSAVRGNELLREKEICTRVLSEIDNGTYRSSGRVSPADLRVEMQRRLSEADRELNGDPGVKYTRAMKSVLKYGQAIAKQIADTPDMNTRSGITEQGLKDLTMMTDKLPSYKGSANVPDATDFGSGGSPELRLAKIIDHLEARVATLDNTRVKHLSEMVENQPVLKGITDALKAGTLPDDGSLVLFNKDGKYLGPQGGTSPYFIEVSRLQNHGIGADGGGFNRFEQIQDQIAGAVVLRPLYDASGKAVELPRGGSNGKVIFKKTVADTIGDVPPEIKPGLDFVRILRDFVPPRSNR